MSEGLLQSASNRRPSGGDEAAGRALGTLRGHAGGGLGPEPYSAASMPKSCGAGLDAAEGTFTVVAQVDALLRPGQKESVIRVIRDVPPTPKEIETITEAMTNFIGPSKELGVEMLAEDLTFTHPTVVMRPIAIYR